MKDNFDKIIMIALGVIFVLVLGISASTCFSNGGSTTGAIGQDSEGNSAETPTIQFSTEG